MPENLRDWGFYAFGNSKNKLKEVVIHDSVTTIGDSIFACCDSLESVTSSKSLLIIA